MANDKKSKELDDLCINTLRFLAADGVEKANSGHPGMPMGDAPMAYTLWTRHLRHNPKNPLFADRDRFVLSAGHGSMLLYSLLHLAGYDMPIEQLKNFRQWGSHTPGHPEYDLSRGIETTTGPLGQGFANAVGMAITERYLADRYNKPGFTLFDYNVYAISGDGDMMEGVSNEAASMAGHLGLGKVICLYSDNKITIEGPTTVAFTEDVAKRFDALKWHVQKIDGNDVDAVSAAIEAAKAETGKPSIIIARTNIGFGSPNKQDTAGVHGSPLGTDEMIAAKEKLGWPVEPAFHVPDEARAVFQESQETGAALETEWKKTFEGYAKEHPELAKELEGRLGGNNCDKWEEKLPEYKPEDGGVATRSASGNALNAIAEDIPVLIGGSADLAPSNNTYMKGLGDLMPDETGRNMHFGVREHAMGAVMNGMASGGLIIPYGGTFLVFSDYMRGAIRVAALSGFQVVYVFTHDSIGLGEDGPTHQPIEHIPSLRAIPNLNVIRPCDAPETSEAWRMALKTTGGPTALILTRQKLPTVDRAKYGSSKASDLSRGGYVIAETPDNLNGGSPQLILIATGSEVEFALGAFDKLTSQGIAVSVVSMPCVELFESQDEEYRSAVLPPQVRARVAVEAGSTQGWHKYVGLDGEVIGVDSFGASAPYKILMEKFGFTVDNVVEKASKVFAKTSAPAS
ncbi:Transketolase [hydrothermal vent metagenome]|uniref:transketolase n=1 Tax=hydrothermal vent metagenome TaxID=652676 RepID=A0A3B0RHN8_9ZZZZ